MINKYQKVSARSYDGFEVRGHVDNMPAGASARRTGTAVSTKILFVKANVRTFGLKG